MQCVRATYRADKGLERAALEVDLDGLFREALVV